MYYLPSTCFSSMYLSITNCINTSVPTGGMHLITHSSKIIKAAETSSQMDQSVQRRTANYKPNIWKYDLLQSFSTNFSEEKYNKRAMRLKEDVKQLFVSENDLISKLEYIDSISKLGLSNYFEEEIKREFDAVGSPDPERIRPNPKMDLYATSLWFRLLRQYGFNPSQEIFLEVVDENGKYMSNPGSDVKGMLELFQASNLHSEGENILKEARLFSAKHLRGVAANSNHKLAQRIFHALSLPLHWKVDCFNIRKYINDLETENKTNSALVELAKLNFNIVQAAHQEDLNALSRWWTSLGITEKLSFSRDRMVESFLYAVGIASEPQYGSLRQWLGKVINLILIIDDVYDIYGSLEELVSFSNAVERWEPEEINELPECMQICFWALYNTTEDIALEIQKEKGLNSVFSYLQKAWADLCDSLLLEAKWDNKGYTPSLKEYLDNAWISSSGPLLALHVILGMANQTTGDISELLKDNRDLINCTSLIIRLCNDQGTSAAELERGDAPSSILCYMREASVSEEAAREHVRNIIMDTWGKINRHCTSTSSTFLQEPVKKHIINTARAAHFMYQSGDGFGEQDLETREQILSSLIEPLALN